MRVFFAHSFASGDRELNEKLKAFVGALGHDCVDGEPPEAGSVSQKVKRRIRQADLFMAIYARRQKLEGVEEWTTSPWVIEEKTYAESTGKRVLLLVESGVVDVGGLHGDLERIPFTRGQLEDCLLHITQALRAVERHRGRRKPRSRFTRVVARTPPGT